MSGGRVWSLVSLVGRVVAERSTAPRPAADLRELTLYDVQLPMTIESLTQLTRLSMYEDSSVALDDLPTSLVSLRVQYEQFSECSIPGDGGVFSFNLHLLTRLEHLYLEAIEPEGDGPFDSRAFAPLVNLRSLSLNRFGCVHPRALACAFPHLRRLLLNVCCEQEDAELSLPDAPLEVLCVSNACHSMYHSTLPPSHAPALPLDVGRMVDGRYPALHTLVLHYANLQCVSGLPARGLRHVILSRCSFSPDAFPPDFAFSTPHADSISTLIELR